MDVDFSMSTESDPAPASAAAADNKNHHGDPAVETSPPAQDSPQEQPAAAASGPRPAPTYSVVNAVIEKKEDGPGSRCGHTLTAVAAVGEEGTPGYVGPRLVLFGGATALEGNNAAAAPPSPAGSAGIREFIANPNAFDVMMKP